MDQSVFQETNPESRPADTAWMELVLQEMDEAALLFDDQGFIFQANDEASRLLEFTRKELAGLGIAQIVQGWQSLSHPEIMAGLKAQGACPLAGEFRAKSGRVFPVRIKTRLLEHAGRRQHLLLARDMADQRQLETRLLRAQKWEAIGLLAGGVAHDFNNMLATILLHIGSLRADPRLPASLQDALKELDGDTRRAMSLPRQLLLFNRYQATQPPEIPAEKEDDTRQLLLFQHRQAMQLRTFRLNDLLENMSNMLRRLIGVTIELEFQPAAAALPVCADRGMIEQVVLNLCVNARDAMPHGGRLTLATEAVEFGENSKPGSAGARPGKFARFRVTDTGCGMDEATLLRIFEPFFTTKESSRGTGLGLAMVSGIVKQHQGWIEVESVPGQGTVFTVFLPLHSQEAEAWPKMETPAGAPGGTETILLLEDNPGLRRIAATTMRCNGYRVLEAANGPEAMTFWNQHGQEIDLLFSDMIVPGGQTGLDLIAQFRKSKPQLKVILSSGYTAEIHSEGNPGLRNVTCLPKPFTRDQLAKALRDCLDASFEPAVRIETDDHQAEHTVSGTSLLARTKPSENGMKPPEPARLQMGTGK